MESEQAARSARIEEQDHVVGILHDALTHQMSLLMGALEKHFGVTKADLRRVLVPSDDGMALVMTAAGPDVVITTTYAGGVIVVNALDFAAKHQHVFTWPITKPVDEVIEALEQPHRRKAAKVKAATTPDDLLASATNTKGILN